MAGIADIIAADLARTAFDTTADETPAETISYTPAGGAAADVVISAWTERAEDEAADDGTARLRTASAIVQASELAAPASGDTLTRNTETWAVRDVRELGAGAAWHLTLVRSEHREKARADYRLRRF